MSFTTRRDKALHLIAQDTMTSIDLCRHLGVSMRETRRSLAVLTSEMLVSSVRCDDGTYLYSATEKGIARIEKLEADMGIVDSGLLPIEEQVKRFVPNSVFSLGAIA